MKVPFLLVTGLAMALAACGKPAAEQPAPQIAGENSSDVAATAAPLNADDGFPAVPSEAEVAAAAAAAGLPVTPENRLRLACDNDEKMVVRFFPEQGIAVLVRGDTSLEMNDEPAASGIRYAGGDVVLTGKGTDYTVEIAPDTVLRCAAVM